MEKKLFAFVLLGIVLLSVSSVSALELNPFTNSKTFVPELKEDMSDFLKEDFNEKYGVIRLSKTFFWVETDKVAEYSLIENTDQCLINCEARGKAVLYKRGKLFDDKLFRDKNGKEIYLNSNYYYKVVEEYIEEIPIYKEVCLNQDFAEIVNGTKNIICENILEDTKKETRIKEVWKEYKGELLLGEYEWKIIANKKPLEKIDFIPVAQGKELSEWAWWSSNWTYKKAIFENNTGATDLINLTYYLKVDTSTLIGEGKLQSDCDDMRFLNFDETTEFKWEFVNKANTTYGCNSTQTLIRVLIPSLSAGGENVYFYYGNPTATAYNNPVTNNFPTGFTWVYDFESSSQKSLTNTGGSAELSPTGTPTQKLGMYGTAFGTTSSSNYFNENDDWAEQSIGTMFWKVKFNGGLSGDKSLIRQDGSGYQQDWHVGWGGSSDTAVRFYIQDQASSTTYDLACNQTYVSGEWIDIAIQWGAGGMRLFYNGTLCGQNAYTGVLGNARDELLLGSESSVDLDDWIFTTKRLSSDEIKKLNQMDNYLVGDEENPEGVSVSLLSPENAFNSSSQTILFNSTIIPSNANITNVTWRAGNQEDSQLLNTNESISLDWTKTFADGSYSWNVTACWIGVSEIESCTESETRTFTIDSIAPNLTLNAPLTNFTTLTLPMNVTLNFTASDSNLDSCWFSSSMNSTNTTFTCNSAQTIAFNSSGAHSFTYYANDTFGGISTGTAPFYIYYVQPSATATNPITEGGFSTNSLWVNMTNIKFFPTNAWLIWNGTNLGAGTPINVSNDSVRFDKTFIVPSINGTLANWTWFYNISGNPNVTNWNVSGAQTFISINLSECGAGTYQILNYTLYDQKTRTIANSSSNTSIETDLTLTSYANTSQTWTFHTTKTSSNNLLICLPSGALNNSEYQLDSIAKYSYQDHVVQYHYIVSFNLNSSTIPQSIKLYDLATAESTSFLLNYQDENYLYVEDAIIDVWRRYVGDGVFVSVEHGKTDAQGQTRLHLVTEDIIYKFLVWQNGELVYTSPEYLALCQATPCQINLRKSINESDGFSERDNILFDYDFDKTTRTATFDFSTKDGTETTINMTILRSNTYANETACTTQLTTSGGQVSCLIPTAFTNTTYQTIIYKDGEYFGTSFDSLAPSSMEIFGYTGIILTAIGYLFLALMGISSGIATIVFGIIGLALMGVVQIFESGSIFGFASAILWLIVAGVIIIIKITKRKIS